MRNLERMLWAVRDGTVDFNEFVRRTRTEFKAMAGYLLRRWQAPEWLIPEDVEQELYIGAWKYLWRYEPDYAARTNTTLEQYVTFNALSEAKRAVHRARGAKLSGSPDRALSRFERPISRVHNGELLADAILIEDPTQEQGLIDHQEREAAIEIALGRCDGPRERIAVLMLAETGGVEEAGRSLYDDISARVALRLGSERDAVGFVARNAVRVAARVRPEIWDEDTGITPG